MTGARILVVDDEPEIRRLVQEILEDEEYEVITAKDAASARDAYAYGRPDLVLLDVWMPDTDGITLLKEWSDAGALAPVVIMSGHGTVDTAVEATRLGASDFIEKPLSTGKLLATVERALQNAGERHERSAENPLDVLSLPVGKSAAMRALRQALERAASSEGCVLITGEPGSGKAVAARYLHQKSARADRPLLEIGFAATPAEAVRERLFGRRKPTPATAGLLERANGGTLLLDEIADIASEAQVQLLRALEAHRFTPANGSEPVALDVHIIATSNQNLEAAVRDGRLRRDLYDRLNVLPIHVPALRDHREDVPELVNFYRDRLVEHQALPYRRLATAAINRLRNHDWPGNVRELRNVVQRLLVLDGEGEVAEAEVERALGAGGHDARRPPSETPFDLPLRAARDQFEKAYLEYHLKRTHGNVSELAAIVDMERTHLYRKLKSLGIDPKLVRSK